MVRMPCCGQKTGAREEPEESVVPPVLAVSPFPEEQKEISPINIESAEKRALTQLKIIFENIDSNKDGNVSKDELINALNADESLRNLINEAGMKQDDNSLNALTTSKEGHVTWDEFQAVLFPKAVEEVAKTGDLAAVDQPAEAKALEQLETLFNALDQDHNQAVSRNELADGLNKDPSLIKLIEEAGLNSSMYVLEQIDENGDGKITWEEFEHCLRSAAKKEVKEEGHVEAVMPILELEEKVAPQNGGWFCCAGK